MSDGSNMGITAGRALKTILGGEDQPTEHLTREQVLERIGLARLSDDPEAEGADNYSAATDIICRRMYQLMTGPERDRYRTMPLNPKHAFVEPGSGEKIGEHVTSDGGTISILRSGTFKEASIGALKDSEYEYVFVDSDDSLFDAARAEAADDEVAVFDGCTWFMVGFAYNQAHWLLELPPQPNPALLTI